MALCRSALWEALALGFRPPTGETVARLASAEGALGPIAGSPSPFFLLRLTAFLREAAARLAPRA